MKTIQKSFDEAMACESKEEATIWLDLEVASIAKEFNQEVAETKRVLLHNLGYWAGYYNDAAAKKMYNLFGAVHPLFKCADYHTTWTAEQCFKLGMELGEKIKNAEKR